MVPWVWRVTRVLILGSAAAVGLSSSIGPVDRDAPEAAAPQQRRTRPAARSAAPKPKPQEAPNAQAPLPPGMLQIRVAHSLARADAHKRMEKLVRYWGKFGIQGEWEGDSARLTGTPLGVEVKADVQVADQSVHGTVKDPGSLLRDRALGYVQWKVARYLDPQTPFEALP